MPGDGVGDRRRPSHTAASAHSELVPPTHSRQMLLLRCKFAVISNVSTMVDVIDGQAVGGVGGLFGGVTVT
jgi:hypothetical protein